MVSFIEILFMGKEAPRSSGISLETMRKAAEMWEKGRGQARSISMLNANSLSGNALNIPDGGTIIVYHNEVTGEAQIECMPNPTQPKEPPLNPKQ